MFQKPFRVKSNTAIKGSDRKRLRAEFSRQYPDVTEAQLSTVISNKDEMTVMKINTHSGDDLLVYMVEKNPVLFCVDSVLFPTVYLLWKFPDIIPLLTTWPEVFKKLSGGADLMLPGVIVYGTPGPQALGTFGKNQGCAVNVRGNRAALAVGKTTMSSSDMYESGMRGKGVIILHTYGDHLWAAGDHSEPPVLPETRALNVTTEDALQVQQVESNDVESIERRLADSHLSDDASCLEPQYAVGLKDNPDADTQNATDSSPMYDANTPTGSADDAEIKTVDRQQEAMKDEQTDVAAASSSPVSMDEMLYLCFMGALKTSAKKAELPLLTSAFFRNFMIPCCPEEFILDVKKSTYKKLSKFLASMKDRGLVEVKELTKGVESITLVNRDHDELQSFRLPEWMKKSQSASETNKAEPGAFSYTPPVVVEMFQVTAAVLPLMKGRSKGDAITAPEVRQVITEYVRSCNLQDPTNKGFVTMDTTLSDILVARTEYIDVMRWEDVVDRCLKKMTPCHQVTFPGSQPEIRRGHFEPIALDVVQRGSNKKMTSVYNLEEFGIDPDSFASFVQKGVACSAVVCPRTDKPKVMQVLVQGNQINYVGQLLRDRYQLPSKFIRGLEKAPKSHKKKT